jgi:hypothetical protein
MPLGPRHERKVGGPPCLGRLLYRWFLFEPICLALFKSLSTSPETGFRREEGDSPAYILSLIAFLGEVYPLFPLSHPELHPLFSGEGSKTGEGDLNEILEVWL